MGLLIPLCWTSGDICHGFQSLHAYMICHLHIMDSSFTSGAMLTDLLVASMAAKAFDLHASTSVQKLVGLKPRIAHAAQYTIH